MAISIENWDTYLVAPDSRERLARTPTGSTDFCGDKKTARKVLKEYRKQIDGLLDALTAEQQRTLLIVLAVGGRLEQRGRGTQGSQRQVVGRSFRWIFGNDLLVITWRPYLN